MDGPISRTPPSSTLVVRVYHYIKISLGASRSEIFPTVACVLGGIIPGQECHQYFYFIYESKVAF